MDPGSTALRAAAHGWVTLGVRGVAGPASKAGEVVMAGPALVLEAEGLLRGLTDRAFEELWIKSR